MANKGIGGLEARRHTLSQRERSAVAAALQLRRRQLAAPEIVQLAAHDETVFILVDLCTRQQETHSGPACRKVTSTFYLKHVF